MFMSNSAYWQSLISFFQKLSASNNKLFILAGRPGTRLSLVYKYYETDCLQNLILHFLFLLTTEFFKKSHI